MVNESHGLCNRGSCMDASDVLRQTPNPNALFELGYAVARLGWSRVVMVSNLALADTSDLPFDIDRQRVSSYMLKGDAAGDKAAREQLCDLVTVAIRIILQKNPDKVTHHLNPDEEKRKRDIVNLRWLLEHVHWPTLQAHLNEAPKFVSDATLHFFETFNGVLMSNSFHLYDGDLLNKIKRVHALWERTLSHANRYDQAPGALRSFFVLHKTLASGKSRRRPGTILRPPSAS